MEINEVQPRSIWINTKVWLLELFEKCGGIPENNSYCVWKSKVVLNNMS